MLNHQVWRSTGRLADGREIIYYDESPDSGRAAAPDRRPLDPFVPSSELRYDPLLDEWVVLAAHRQNRTFLPPPDECPLDPTAGERRTEIPAADYDVVVFENRFPSLATPKDAHAPELAAGGEAVPAHPGVGRCEVVCFTSDHSASFAGLSPHRARTVIEAWADRTTALNRMPEVRAVYPFENRGEEIGVTLNHPHGQIYGYPFVPPRTARVRASAARHREHTGGNLFDDIVEAERKAGTRVITETEHWTAFVPAAARWPYEVQLFPQRRVPDLPSLDAAQRDDLAHVYLGLLRAFDRLFSTEAPYISAWNQSPVDAEGSPDPDFGLHLQLFTLRRAPGKLKYLAGSESGMAAWINDISPEDAARRLRSALADSSE